MIKNVGEELGLGFDSLMWSIFLISNSFSYLLLHLQMEMEAKAKRLKAAVCFAIAFFLSLLIFLSSYNLFYDQVEDNENASEIVEKAAEIETNVAASQEMELSISHILEKIENFTHLVLTI